MDKNQMLYNKLLLESIKLLMEKALWGSFERKDIQYLESLYYDIDCELIAFDQALGVNSGDREWRELTYDN